ncbi:MAG: MAPEG family protein [Alphaproteobacteria bacterium]|nr:MAG: MAPEG family protein [Alphaproteobacteria bacterium]
MTISQWVLFGFALWTLVVLMFGIGVSRWSRVLTGRAALTDFPGDQPHGSPRYRRIIRAHANCLENLPILMVLVYLESVTGLQSALFAQLAVVLLACRVLQTLTHVIFSETSATVLIRFLFFISQIFCMIAMGWLVWQKAAPTFPML